MATVIQLRRDTAANWTANDPILAAAEIGVETDTAKIKIGDGASLWSELSYFGGAGSTIAVQVDDTLVATADTLDFGHGLTADEDPSGEANVSVVESDLSHADLSGGTAADAHPHVHELDGSGSVAHSSLTGQTTDDHHAQVHDIDGENHSGTLAHGDLGTVGANDHHADAHTNAKHGTAGTPSTSTPGNSADAGASTADAKSDHVHAVTDTTAGPDANIGIDADGAAGTAHQMSQAGHGHRVNTTDAPTGADITIDAAATPAATGAIARAAHGHRLTTYSSEPCCSRNSFSGYGNRCTI